MYHIICLCIYAAYSDLWIVYLSGADQFEIEMAFQFALPSTSPKLVTFYHCFFYLKFVQKSKLNKVECLPV